MIRLGICNELFEDWPLAKVCDAVRELGYDGLELAPFTLAPRIDLLSAAQRAEIRTTIQSRGLTAIGLHWLLAKTEGLHLTHPDPKVRAATLDYLCSLAHATRDLGGSLMVLGSPKQRDLLPDVSASQATDWVVELFKRLGPTLASCDVDLCLEPLAPSETNFINTLAQTIAIIERVDHPRVKVHLDVKAMSADTGGSITELVARYAPTAGHVHVQDPGTLRGPGMGDLDFRPILRSLVESNYTGWVSVEVFDFSAGAIETARESMACLRATLGATS